MHEPASKLFSPRVSASSHVYDASTRISVNRQCYNWTFT